MITKRIIRAITFTVIYAAGWVPVVLVSLAVGHLVGQLLDKIHGPVHEAFHTAALIILFAYAAWLLTSFLALVAQTSLHVRLANLFAAIRRAL